MLRLSTTRARLRANTTALFVGLIASAGVAQLATAPVADAAAKKTTKAAVKKAAQRKAAAKKRAAEKRATVAPATPEAPKTDLAAKEQLAAMNVAIAAAPAFFAVEEQKGKGHEKHESTISKCSRYMPVLTKADGPVLGGNFRGEDGGCYVWLNISYAEALTGPEICKNVLHEMGHLLGRWHTDDVEDIMYGTFRAEGIPAVCEGV